MTGQSLHEVLQVQGALTPAIIEQIAGRPTLHLVLSQEAGWDGSGLDQLGDAGCSLSSLTISHQKAIDISVISTLPTLRTLSISGGVKGSIELSSTRLRGLAVYAKPGRVKITGSSESLKRVAGSLDADALGSCLSGGLVEALTLVKPRMEALPDAASLQGLRLLQIIDGKALVSIAPALRSASLEYLKVNGCRALSIDTAIISARLKYLAVNDCAQITSMRLFAACSELEVVSLLGSTLVQDKQLDAFVRRVGLRHMRLTMKAGYDVDQGSLPLDVPFELQTIRKLEALSAIHEA